VSKLRILLVDDHTMIRTGLQLAINGQADMEVVGQAGNGTEALAEAQRCRPDVVVIDVSLPDIGGADVTEAILRQVPAVRVLAFTRHGDPGYLRRLLQAGANGYMLKSADANALVNAIRTVAEGGTYIDPMLAGSIVETVVGPRDKSAAPQSPFGDLTTRERDVLRLIAWGRSNKEIAAQFGISVKTVEYYKAQATDKLQLHSRTDIVRYALSQGWLHADLEPE
jgi:DNA-binding NarL/FixJ family response regulator